MNDKPRSFAMDCSIPPDEQKAHAPPEPLRHEGVLRGGVVTYVVALLLIAAFSVAFHFITDHIVHQQDATARVVNVSGRQRMLSQRIARLGLERAAHTSFRPDEETNNILKSSIDLIATSHQELLRDAAPAAGMGLAVMTFGIDRFKSVNDRFGRSAGDDVIHEMVMRMIGQLKSSQRLCRMGGEEFAVLMRAETLSDAAPTAEEFRRRVEAIPFPVQAHEGTVELPVTVSVGVAALVESDVSIFTVMGVGR